MIKANELRIGNWVNDIGEKQVEAEDIPTYFYSGLPPKPIPLTEGWLLKFGFYKLDNEYYTFQVQDFDIRYYYNVSGSTWKFELCDNLIGIEYIHQLQNLYFALTGEELTIKE